MTPALGAGDPACYATVLRASSAIRIPLDQHFQSNTTQGDEVWQLTLRTRYLDSGPGQRMPRELWIEVVGPANKLDAAKRHKREPLTLRTARRVGAILKHVSSDQSCGSRYAYYM